MHSPVAAEEQLAYWRAVDADRFRWQTEDPYIAREESALLDGIDLRGERLLEIGCGEGANLHHLARRRGARGTLFGIDFAPDRARFARAATGAITAGADAARLPLCDAAFDAVLVRDLLHHVPDRAAVLAEAVRVLRPGGRLTLIEPNRGNPLIAAMAVAVRAERGMLASTAERLSGEARAAGLVEVSAARRQAMPVSRVLLHYRIGFPSLGRAPAVQWALGRIERAAARLPGWLWAYVVVTGRKA